MPTTISGTGGITFPNSSVQSVAGLGANAQTWQSVTGSRAIGTTYTNSTGYPIFVAVTLGGGSSTTNITINGVAMYQQQVSNAGFVNTSTTFVVPNGATYGLIGAAGSPTVVSWAELR